MRVHAPRGHLPRHPRVPDEGCNQRSSRGHVTRAGLMTGIIITGHSHGPQAEPSEAVSQRQTPLSEAEASLRGSLRGIRTREHMDATHKHARESLGRQRIRCGASCDGIRGHQRASEGIRGHQRASEGIRGHRRASEHRCGASCGALCGTYVSFTPLWPEGHRSARVVTSAHELLEGEAYLWGRGAPW
jgi:hypothetical protein